MTRDEKILELTARLRKDRGDLLYGALQCLLNEEEVTAERIARYSYNSVSYVRAMYDWWKDWV